MAAGDCLPYFSVAAKKNLPTEFFCGEYFITSLSTYPVGNHGFSRQMT
jgi:hypothetical protein